MFKNLILGALFFALSASVGFAQTTGEYNKVEVFGGYSNNQIDTGLSDDDQDLEDFFEDRRSFNGFNASVVGNFSRYVGAKGDISGHYKNEDITVPAFGAIPAQRLELKSSVYNFLGGVQVKDNAVEGSRVRPFAHGLIGVARGKSEFGNSNSLIGNDFDNDADYGFAAAVGGGIDIKATNRLSIRAIQVDYNPTRFNDSTQHNFRFGVGLVFH